MTNKHKSISRCANAGLVILFSLWMAPTATGASYLQQLQAADNIRSSKPRQFAEQLANLQQHQAQLSPFEQHYLRYLIGYQYSFNGDFERAIDTYQQLLNADATLAQKIRTKLSLINIYAVKKNWLAGLQYLNNTTAELSQLQDKDLQANGLAVAAVFLNALNQYPQALSYAQRLKLAAVNNRQQCMAVQLSLEAQAEMGTIGADDPQFATAYQQCQHINEVVIASVIIATQAKLYLTQGQPHTTIDLLERHLSALQLTAYKPTLAVFYALLSEAYWQQQRPQQAKLYAQQAIAILDEQAPLNGPRTRAYQVLYQYYRAQGNYPAALEAHIQYANTQQANLDEIKTKTVAYQLAQHQGIEQQSRITLLNQQNRLLTLQQKLADSESHTQRALIIALICVIALLLLGTAQFWRNQRHFRQLAQYDGLTQIFSRNHFTVMAQRLLEQAQRYQEPVSCVMFDIDHFKQINDTKGHKTGDWALQKIAALGRKVCRHNDLLGRVGGEEFCILLPQTQLLQARDMAERLRQQLAALHTGDSGFEFSLTASFGVAEAAISGYKLEQLMHDADQAMYLAKMRGRNRVCDYTPATCTTLEQATPAKWGLS
ncbi:diguanylate cyclase [Shewanella sp. YIC-542]|uniref:tetratricopeptide repeat-containing diguanylate cyclase n=1 Tax=Shewanella mytili TaxID=3377111 RepID=UPI00398F2550